MLGEILSVGSMLANNLFAGSRQEDAQDFSAQQFASRYQTTVKDLKSAGLSPMLAYGQGGGNAPTSSAASAASSADIGSTHIQSKIANAQVANIEADTQNKLEQASLIRSQAAQAMSSANQADANVTKIGQEVMNLKEQFKNIPLEGQRLVALVDQLAQQAGLFVQQGMTQSEVRDQLRALISKLKSETKLLDLDVQAAESLDNVGRETGQLKPFFDIVRSLIKR